MPLNWAWNWEGSPPGGCCPPLSLCCGAGAESLSLASLFSLPSAVEGFPATSTSPVGEGVPRPGPASSGVLLSISEGLEAMFRFLPPPSRQLPTSAERGTWKKAGVREKAFYVLFKRAAKLSSQSGRTGFLTLRSETGARSIRFFLLLARFLRLTRCLQAGELLMELAAYPWSPYTEKETFYLRG